MSRRRGNREGTIYQRRDGRWEAALPQVGGKRKRLYGRTREEVAARLMAAMSDQQQGLPATDDRIRLEPFLARWLEDSIRPAVRPWTHRGYEVAIRLHIVPTLGKVRLSRLTPQDVQALMARLAAEGLSPKSIRNVRTVLSAALAQAERWGMVRRNAVRLVQPPRREQHEIQPFTPDEARCFLVAVQGHRLEALFTVALTLGLRQGEALGLTWGDVDLSAGALHVRHQLQRVSSRLRLVPLKTTRSRRTIAMPPSITAALKAHRQRQLAEGRALLPSAYVFTTPAGGPLEARTVLRWFADLLDGAGLRHIRFHDLRHSAATLMLIQGVPARVVMDMLGHADMSMVTTYQHVVPELQQEAARRIEAFLAGPPVTAAATATHGHNQAHPDTAGN